MLLEPHIRIQLRASTYYNIIDAKEQEEALVL